MASASPIELMKLGLSLSFCVQDIVRGKVNIDEVHHIFTACSPRDEDELEREILQRYCQVYWRDNPEKAREVVRELRDRNKISWLSSFDRNPCITGQTMWLDWPD